MLASSYLVLVLLVLSLSLCFSIFLSLCMYVYLSVYLSLYICLSVTLSVSLYLSPLSLSFSPLYLSFFPPYLSPLSLSLNPSLSFYQTIKNFLLLKEQIIFCWTRTFLKKMFNVITDVTYVLTVVTLFPNFKLTYCKHFFTILIPIQY
jgi:hypothetical protein